MSPRQVIKLEEEVGGWLSIAADASRSCLCRILSSRCSMSLF